MEALQNMMKFQSVDVEKAISFLIEHFEKQENQRKRDITHILYEFYPTSTRYFVYRRIAARLPYNDADNDAIEDIIRNNGRHLQKLGNREFLALLNSLKGETDADS